jgi:hypothetical protein
MADQIKIEGCDDRRGRDGLLKCLKQFECETVICILKSGEGCCRQEGMVCDVNKKCGLITLLDDDDKIFIPIDAIAAIIKKKCCN